jgi:hypothetical protein
MNWRRFKILLNLYDTALQSRDMIQQSIEASFNVNINVIHNKSLALNTPYDSAVSVQYELWKIHGGPAIHAREQPPSLNVTNRDVFKIDGAK